MDCLTPFPLCADYSAQLIPVKGVNVTLDSSPTLQLTTEVLPLPVINLFALIHTCESPALRRKGPCSLTRIFSYCWFCIRKWETIDIFRVCCKARTKAQWQILTWYKNSKQFIICNLKGKEKRWWIFGFAKVDSFLGESKNPSWKKKKSSESVQLLFLLRTIFQVSTSRQKIMIPVLCDA